MLLVFLIAKTKAKHQYVFILRDINAESKLFAPSDVEAQAVVIWGGEEVDDSAQSVVRAGLRRRVTAFLHHHPPVNQVHPACIRMREELTYTLPLSKNQCTASPFTFLISVLVYWIAIKVTAVIHPPPIPHETVYPIWKETSVSCSQVKKKKKTWAIQRSVAQARLQAGRTRYTTNIM